MKLEYMSGTANVVVNALLRAPVESTASVLLLSLGMSMEEDRPVTSLSNEVGWKW